MQIAYHLRSVDAVQLRQRVNLVDKALPGGHGREVTLTAKEFALLEFLVLHAGEVVGRGAIAEHVWDAPFESMSNVIDVMVQRLRRKIDPAEGPSLIATRRGEGYMLVVPDEARRP